MNGTWVGRCAEILAGSEVLICSVVGFPLNASAPGVKAYEAQRTVDNAHMRYFIAHLHRLRDEEAAASSTEELG